MPLGIRLRSRPSRTGILSRIARTPSGLPRDCARPAYPSNGPRGSESHRFTRLHIQNLDWRIAKRALELRGRAIHDRKGPVVYRYDLLGPDQFAQRVGRALGIHGEVAADADQRQVRLVELADQRHVAEHVGVAGVIDPEAV